MAPLHFLPWPVFCASRASAFVVAEFTSSFKDPWSALSTSCRRQDRWFDQVGALFAEHRSFTERAALPHTLSSLPPCPWTQLTVCHISTVLPSQRSRASKALLTMSSPFAAQYVTGIYLPSAALLIGTAAFKSEWLPYAIALTAVLTGAVLFSSQGMRIDPLDPSSR